MERSYYEFHRPGWRFTVLDGMYVSVEGGRLPGVEESRAAQEWSITSII